MHGEVTDGRALQSADSDPARAVQEMRERVLQTFLRWLSWTAVLTGALILLQASLGHFLNGTIWSFVVFSQCSIALRIAAPKLGYRLTVQLFLGWLFLLVLHVLIFRGLTAGSALLNMVFVCTATMLFGMRGAIHAVGACLVCLGIAAAVIMTKTVTPIDSAFWDPMQTLVWVRYCVVFVALGGTIAVVFARMIEQLEAQLHALHQTLERERNERARREAMQLELERAQRFETLALLAGGIAHDLNNTLSMVMGSAELIQLTPGCPAEISQQAEEIIDAASMSADTVRQLLTLGRRDEVKPQRVQLRDCMQRLSAAFIRMLSPGVSLRMNVSAGCEIAIDMARFQRVLLNLTVNARDAMPDGGELLIEVAPAAASGKAASLVRIDFRDTGTGMDEATRRQIFEPFFTTKGPGKGTGLGLAMVQTVMQDAGGHVEVTSSLGRGTTISLFLPSLTTTLSASAATDCSLSA